jgi:ABC-type glycerol-3-phosphate transport system substrate-binding protein
VPLDTYVGRPFLDGFHPGVTAQGRVQGVLMALPWMVSPRALYYNADRLTARSLSPPQTPEQLLDVAVKANDPPAVYGFGLPAAPEGGAADFFLTFFRAQGGVLFDQNGRLALSGDPGRQTLELLAGLVQQHATQPETLTWQPGELEQAFLSGRFAMLIDGPWLLREATRHPPPFTLGVVPVPRVETGTEHLTTDCVIIFDTARDVEGCVQFLEYALGAESQRQLAALGVVPVRRDAAQALPRGEGWEVFRRALRDGRGPSATTWGRIAPLLERMMYCVLSGRATPQEALDALDVDLVDDPEPGGPNLRLGQPHR